MPTPREASSSLVEPSPAAKGRGPWRPSERVLERLTSSEVDELVGSRLHDDATWRDTLASLYTLATKLHSPAVRFVSDAIETRKDRHITTEQVWGQLNMLTRPVLRQLEENVRRAQRLHGTDGGGVKVKKAGPLSSSKAGGGKDNHIDHHTHSDSDGGEEGKEEAVMDVASTRTSQLDESELDEEIETLLAKQAAKRKARKSAKEGDANDGDRWRYAFGKDNVDEDGDEEEDDWDGEDSEQGTSRRRRQQEADEEREEEDNVEDDAPPDRRARRRNLRAMADAEDEEEEEADMEDGPDAEGELAALRELYGDDFEDDGHGFLAADEDDDPDMVNDIELDDPANEGGDDFHERDGMYFGKGDILNDDAGDFEEDRRGGDFYDGERDGDEDAATHGAVLDEMDNELLSALQDPNLSELQKERLREQHMVRKMEEKRLFTTDWSMVGETAASKRPRDALLEVEDIEFEYGMKATPVITEAFTAKLEDRIKQRIQDENYDDVQRAVALSTEADIAHPKYDAALDAQKSKMSLMDLYEKEYLAKQRLADEAAGGPDAPTAEPLTEIEKDELRAIQMWQRLAQHLDALSNFHYTPKPVQQDLDARVRAVENQAPAVVIENVGNFATTRENALAPQDLYRGSSRRFADVGSNELTPKERHALRRSKKESGMKDKKLKEARDKRRDEGRKKQREEQQQKSTGRAGRKP